MRPHDVITYIIVQASPLAEEVAATQWSICHCFANQNRKLQQTIKGYSEANNVDCTRKGPK